MEQDLAYVQQLMAENKRVVMPLLRYLPWLEQKSGKSVSSNYQGEGIEEHSVPFPVYDGTLMRFVKEAAASSLMERNYPYVYSRNHLKSHDDERKAIASATWKEWDILRGILSKYVLGGRVKAYLWSEAVTEGIFCRVLGKMKEIIEYWDQPFQV
ncbi:MAG: DUF6508 domain-containing protein [Candidatus Gastranaerophilales bacterium]|nr:DUF6508 domain-containing protein [Candidatus Gastranaerophilales bacterium]